jgi:hypothetical protein
VITEKYYAFAEMPGRKPGNSCFMQESKNEILHLRATLATIEVGQLRSPGKESLEDYKYRDVASTPVRRI